MTNYDEMIKWKLIHKRTGAEISRFNPDDETLDAPVDLVLPGELGGRPVTKIGVGAFQNCAELRSVTIPAKVSVIRESAFCGCFSLERILVDEGNEFFTSIDGVLYSKDLAVLARFPEGRTEDEFSVPAGTKIIGKAAFFGCASLRRVILPEGVLAVDEYAFWHCGLAEKPTFPESLCEIAPNAFGEES